jgi:hypothetical protein
MEPANIKCNLYSKKSGFTRTMGKILIQTENAIFTLKIAFSSRVRHASLRHQTASIPFHMNSVESQKKKQTRNEIFTFSRIIWDFLHGDSKHKMQSVLQEFVIQQNFAQTLEPNSKRNLYIKDCVFKSAKSCYNKTSNHISSLPHDHRWIPKKNTPQPPYQL